MSWPGTQAPLAEAHRRRRKARREGSSAAERRIAQEARKLGLAPRPKPLHGGVVTLCAAHLEPELLAAMGFVSVEALLDYTFVQGQRASGKPLASVRLPRWKCPSGVIRIVAVRCKRCGGTGAGCPSPCGFGYRFYASRKNADHQCPASEAKP